MEGHGQTGWESATAAEVCDAIGQLHGIEAATRRQLLRFVVAYDRDEGWRADGALRMAEWLSMRLALSRRTAAEWVRVAHALEALPAVAAAFEAGRLSWDQLVPLTAFADADTDEMLAAEAPGWTPAQIEAGARHARRVAEAMAAHRDRSLRLRWSTDGASLRLTGNLPATEGAVVVAAIERLAGQAPADASGVFEHWESRCADALVELASTAIAADADADRTAVVLHVDAEALTGGIGLAELERGPSLTGEAARRLACDCRRQIVLHGADGAPVGVGRTTRQVPSWMVRQLRHRDGGCRFPGCGRSRWVHAHHVVHWADGGPTDLANLVLLCGRHHHLVHEAGWAIGGHPDHEVRFRRPDGRPLPTGPPALTPPTRRRARQLVGVPGP